MAEAGDTRKESVYYDLDEQPGLEVAQETDKNKHKDYYGASPSEGPEAIPKQGGIEVVPGSSPPLERRSSLNQPESWHLPHQQQQQPLMEQEKQAHGVAQEYDGEKDALPTKWTRRRYFGMRGKWLAILLATILLVVIAAVLGGVLGTVLTSSDSANISGENYLSGAGGGTGNVSGNSSQAVTGSKKARSQSGIAATFLGNNQNDTLLTYYQDDSNRIIENVYVDGAWASDTSSAAAVVANASAGSPLAAISYNYDDTIWRQVFYVADDTSIWTTKATENGAWEEPEELTIDPSGSVTNLTSTHAAPGPALTACYGFGNLTGIRVYYGDTAGYIQEIGRFFNETSWHAYDYFSQSDPTSGVGCNYYEDASDPDSTSSFMNVYYRNTSSLELQQSWLSLDGDTEYPGWNSGPSGDGISIGSGTAITVTANASAEYVFFQSSNGSVTRGTFSATSSEDGVFDNLGNAISGARLASAYFEGGTVYMFQNSTDDTTIWLSNWDTDGNLETSQRLPGTGED